MSDPYGSSESEDMSLFLQTLPHSSSSSAAASPTAAGLFYGGDVPASESDFNFSDRRSLFVREIDGSDTSKGVIQTLVSSCEESEASEVPANPVPPRSSSSSKRTRAAEVHNLSEKRRRSRINEKLNALQSLVPNSNKTDKASMLDEAIEYLKQLQLQMLTVRNGLRLEPILVPPVRLELDDENVLSSANRTLSMNNGIFTQSGPDNITHRSSVQPMLMPSTANSNNLGILPRIAPSMQNYYGLNNNLAVPKDIRRESHMSCSEIGNSSSPGVSS